MQQLTYIVSGAVDVQRTVIEAKGNLAKIPHIEMLLVTIVTQCEMPLEDALKIRDAVRKEFPAARILGHTSALKMAGLRMDTEGVLLTFTAFEASHVDVFMLEAEEDAPHTQAFLSFLSEHPHTKAVEFLVVGLVDHLDDAFSALSSIDEGIGIFGAFVDAAPMNLYGYAFADEQVLRCGFFAVVYHGETLDVRIVRNFGWRTLGREIIATRIEGCTVKELDGGAPFKVYEKYFGIHSSADFGLDAALFPLCFEDAGGTISARVPLHLERESGAITFGLPLHEGTVFRLAYGDPYGILSKAAENYRELSAFSPQAIMGVACLGHYLLLGDDVVSEMLLCGEFPSSLSFVFGEVRRAGGRICADNLNVMLVGMKEDPGYIKNIKLRSKRVSQLSYNRKMLAFLSHFIRVSEEELYCANQRLSHLASRDALTNLLNRRGMERVLKSSIEQAREHKTPLSVILLDIDHFKSINDTYGHDMGDKVILTVADVISRTIRGSDAGCRWGGDEFFIILQGAPLAVAGKVGERIRRSVESSRMPFDRHITVSVGVAPFDPEKDNELKLFKNADEALYQAKALGRNTVYCPGIGRISGAQ